jgi:hypothetical protein
VRYLKANLRESKTLLDDYHIASLVVIAILLLVAFGLPALLTKNVVATIEVGLSVSIGVFAIVLFLVISPARMWYAALRRVDELTAELGAAPISDRLELRFGSPVMDATSRVDLEVRDLPLGGVVTRSGGPQQVFPLPVTLFRVPVLNLGNDIDNLVVKLLSVYPALEGVVVGSPLRPSIPGSASSAETLGVPLRRGDSELFDFVSFSQQKFDGGDRPLFFLYVLGSGRNFKGVLLPDGMYRFELGAFGGGTSTIRSFTVTINVAAGHIIDVAPTDIANETERTRGEQARQDARRRERELASAPTLRITGLGGRLFEVENLGRGPALKCRLAHAEFLKDAGWIQFSTDLFDVSSGKTSSRLEPASASQWEQTIVGDLRVQAPVSLDGVTACVCEDEIGRKWRFVGGQLLQGSTGALHSAPPPPETWRPGEPEPSWIHWHA